MYPVIYLELDFHKQYPQHILLTKCIPIGTSTFVIVINMPIWPNTYEVSNILCAKNFVERGKLNKKSSSFHKPVSEPLQ